MTGFLRKPSKCLFDSQKPQRGFAEETPAASAVGVAWTDISSLIEAAH